MVKLVINGLLTGGAMYCIFDLEHDAILAGINGTQFMYVVVAIGALGGITLAPLIEKLKGVKPSVE